MTTTSRGLGEGPGPTPASKQRSDRIMSGKVHGRGGSCGGRDDVAAPDARGDQERARDDDGAREKRHARTEALVRETRPDRPDHAGDAPQGLLHPQHQSVLVLVRAVADERRVGGEQQRRPQWQERLIHEKHRYGARQWNQEIRSEEHTSELQSRLHLVCRLLLEKKKKKTNKVKNNQRKTDK